MTQAVEKQESILDRVQNLTPQQQEEVLNFIDFLQFKGQKQEIESKKRRKWADIKGKAPYPLVGEDAQIWLLRSR